MLVCLLWHRFCGVHYLQFFLWITMKLGTYKSSPRQIFLKHLFREVQYIVCRVMYPSVLDCVLTNIHVCEKNILSPDRSALTPNFL